MKLQHTLALTLPMLSSWAVAADLSVKFELPQLQVAEYHRPYVAMWIERADQSVAATLAVLYDVKKKDDAGLKWVKDMRTWWRKAGRDTKLPMDGVSGATRPAGTHTLTFPGTGGKGGGIDKLPAGDYKLVVEAAREAGGRELVRVPFTLPARGKASAAAQGKEELGNVTLNIN